MLEQLFGSRTRTKLLYLFLEHPEEAFFVREITRQIKERINSVRRELDNLEKLVVGVNVFTTEPEKTTPLGVQRISGNSSKDQIEGVRKLKLSRDHKKLEAAIDRLRDDAAAGRNTIPAMIDATQAMATTGELLGTVREVFGYSYDPLNIIESPFK